MGRQRAIGTPGANAGNDGHVLPPNRPTQPSSVLLVEVHCSSIGVLFYRLVRRRKPCASK